MGLAEVLDQLFQRVVLDLCLAVDLGLEVDVLEDASQRLVLVFQGGQRFVERFSDVGVQVFQCRLGLAVTVHVPLVPAGAWRDVEGVAIRGLVLQQQRDLFVRQMRVAAADRGARLIEDVGHALEEQQAEYVLLVLAGVHLAAQDVGGLHEEAFELGESDFAGGHGVGESHG